jgi:hypothetical protein
MPDKEISVAAPASFWYLKGFPIKLMSDYCDYIVYMTYDLHGQVSSAPRSYTADDVTLTDDSGIITINGRNLAAQLVIACALTSISPRPLVPCQW